MTRLGRRRSRRAGGFRPSGLPGGTAGSRMPGSGLPGYRAPRGANSGYHPSGAAGAVRMRPSGRGRDGVIGGGMLTRAALPARRGRLARAGRPARAGRAGRGAGRPAAPRLRIGHGPGARRPATPRFRSRPLAGAGLGSGKRPRYHRRRWRVLAVLTSRPGSRRDVWRVGGRP